MMNKSRQIPCILFFLKSMLLGIVLLLPLYNGIAQIQHSSVQIPVGNSDTNGFARLDKEFYKLPLGNGKSVDLFFMFSTDPRMEPSYMGMYWTIPFFNSKIIKLSAKTYRWVAPNLRNYTFNKLPNPERGFKETYVLNTTGQLKLNVSRDGSIHIVNTKIPNYKFLIKDNRISTFCVGKNADIFKIIYDTSNRPQTIYNTTKNRLELKFLYNEHKLLSQITFISVNKNVFVKYGNTNLVNTNTRGFHNAVSTIIFVDGNSESYTYSQRTEKQDRTILSKKGEKLSLAKVPINRFEQKYKDSKSSQFIEWDATTGIITSDSGGIYSIRNPIFDQYSPDYNNSGVIADRKREIRTKESRISYKKPENKYPEVWDYSLKTAIKITQDPNTGEQTRTSYIGNPGNNSMKIRKIEKRIGNDDSWKLVVNKFYNTDGYLIRDVDNLGNVREYYYNNLKKYKIICNGDIEFYDHSIAPNTDIISNISTNYGKLTVIYVSQLNNVKRTIYKNEKQQYLIEIRKSSENVVTYMIYPNNEIIKQNNIVKRK